VGRAKCRERVARGGIIVNPLTYSGYYDIALRDFGPMLGALTLARLTSVHDPPGLEVRLWRRTAYGLEWKYPLSLS
jgi:hypothetical protein